LTSRFEAWIIFVFFLGKISSGIFVNLGAFLNFLWRSQLYPLKIGVHDTEIFPSDTPIKAKIISRVNLGLVSYLTSK